MMKYISPILGLLFLQAHISQSARTVFGSGSSDIIEDFGSGAIWSKAGSSNIILEGSGSVFESSTKPNRNSNSIIISDDEDDAEEFGSGQGNKQASNSDDIEIGSGTDEEVTKLPDMSTYGIHCGNYYCYCLDKDGNQVPGTEYFKDGLVEETVNNVIAVMRCFERVTAPPTSTSSTTPEPKQPPADPDLVIEETVEVTEPVVVVETIPAKTRTSTHVPYVVGGDITPKHDKPAEVEDPDKSRDSSGSNGLTGRDDGDVLKEPALTDSTLFTHPGILAAIIGGGIVALLSALLLIMFIVYRMRKKDEGSYPLDADSKPPRLHTYTRAPNKEFYA